MGSLEGVGTFAAAGCQLLLKFAYRALQVFQSAPGAVSTIEQVMQMEQLLGIGALCSFDLLWHLFVPTAKLKAISSCKIGNLGEIIGYVLALRLRYVKFKSLWSNLNMSLCAFNNIT